MITVSLPPRFYTVPLPYPRSTAVLVFLLLLLVVQVARAGRWWATRDDPVGRGEPYGRVIPDPEWKEPVRPDSWAELGDGGKEPSA